MKIALISDIHGNLIALQETLKDIENRKIDTMYCLGDLVGYGPFPNEVIDLIKEKNIPTIQGNYDEKVTKYQLTGEIETKDIDELNLKEKILKWTYNNISKENIKWLSQLPAKLEFEIEDKKILLVHGSPRRNNEYLYEDSTELEEIASMIDVDIMVCGHTHLAYHKVDCNVDLINAGSIGRPKHGSPNITYMILNIVNSKVDTELVELKYDYEIVAQAIERSSLPNEIANKIRKGIK